MKFKILFIVLTLSLMGSFSEASWRDYLPGSGNKSQPTTQAQTSDNQWSWDNVKLKVKEKWNTWVARFQNKENTPGADGRLPASVGDNTATTTDLNVPEQTKIEKVATQVKSINVARTAKPAVAFSPKHLIMGHNNVPVFEFKKWHAQMAKVKRVPLLDLGEEEVLDNNSFSLVTITPYPTLATSQIKSLEEPALASASDFSKILGSPVAVANPPEPIIIPILAPEKKVTKEKVASIVYRLNPDIPYTEMAVNHFTEEDLKLLRALVLYEKKDQCHIASGIFADLTTAEKPDVNESSRFHLGVCLHEMNLPTESLTYLTKTMHSKNPKFAHDSIKSAVEDLPLEYENMVGEALIDVDSANIPKDSLAQVNYLKAKYFIRKEQPKKALEVALSVAPKTAPYYKAQYVAAIAEYELKRLDESIARQKTIAAELEKNGKDKDLLTLFQLNIGREAFQQGKFKDSLDAFQKVPKETAFWIPALMEQGWAQLQSKDMPGAIGNMHSIESPYFNGVFKPESYVVRSIAYLNICQYADAFKSMAFLEHIYEPWLVQLKAYNANHTALQAYETVLKHLKSKTATDVDQLPFQVIREAAREKDFINTQAGINQLVDEGTGYTFIKGLIEKDKKSLNARRVSTIASIASLKQKIKTASTTPGAMKNFNSWRFELANNEDFLSVYDFKMKTIDEGLAGLSRMAPKAVAHINDVKNKQKSKAGQLLKDNLVKVAKELTKSLENNELLKYEVYAGSGENLRYKIAGGKTGGSANMSNRAPAGQHWDFDGEYWEDEIGNYRSSMKNNCQNVAAGQKGK
jgi:tetratricopeptide (TPR) repeat protein